MIRRRIHLAVGGGILTTGLLVFFWGQNVAVLWTTTILWAVLAWVCLFIGARETKVRFPVFPPTVTCPRNGPCELMDTWIKIGGDLLLILSYPASNPTIKFIGPGFKSDLGWEPEALQGKPWKQFIHPDDWNITLARMQEVGHTGTVQFTNRWRHFKDFDAKQSRWIWLEWEVLLVPELSLLYAHARNMTNRFEREAQMATWSMITSDLMAVADTAIPIEERKFEWVNEAWVRNLGWTMQDLYSMRVVDFLDPKSAPQVLQVRSRHEAVGDTGISIQECSVRCKGEPPRFKNYEWISIIHNGTLYTSGRNIDEEVHSRAELRKAIQDLETRNNDLERFASMTAHQLRSPPRTIAGIAQALQEDYGDKIDDAGRQFLADIRTDADHMAEIVDGLYRFSKVRTGTDLSLEPVDLQALMPEILAGIQKQDTFGENDRLQWCNLPVVLGEKVLLVEVLKNLVDNGFKFNESSPKVVTVESTLREDGRWEIRVQDNGIGIDPQYQPKVFQMFQRMHPQYKGTGVGMALVAAIVQKLGGSISVASEVGKGTIITFDLEAAWKSSV